MINKSEQGKWRPRSSPTGCTRQCPNQLVLLLVCGIKSDKHLSLTALTYFYSNKHIAAISREWICVIVDHCSQLFTLKDKARPLQTDKQQRNKKENRQV